MTRRNETCKERLSERFAFNEALQGTKLRGGEWVKVRMGRTTEVAGKETE